MEFSLVVVWLNTRCSQGVCAAPHKPEGHTACVAQYSTVQSSPAPAYVGHYVHHQFLNMQHSPIRINDIAIHQ